VRSKKRKSKKKLLNSQSNPMGQVMTEIDHSAHTDGRFGSISQRISPTFKNYSLFIRSISKKAVNLQLL
jgi:hypothetical protein